MLCVPAEETHLVETPAGDTPSPEAPMFEEQAEADMEQENGSGDVEMDFTGHVAASQGIGSLEPDFDDQISELLLAEMGSSGRVRRRDGRRAFKKIVSEICSPPRVTDLLRRTRSRHVMAGFALDLTVLDEDGTPWDFTKEEKRNKARRLVRTQKPYMLIGSPSCKEFSTWQALNAAKTDNVQAMRRARAAAVLHLNFVAELYQEQTAGGRYFLHEHPLNATSWQERSISELLQRPDVARVHGDQCQFGATATHGPGKGSPIKKPTGFMTNAPEVAAALQVRCTGQGGACSRPGGGDHVLCSGKDALDAAKYPKDLCRAVLRGVRNQLRRDGVLKEGCFGVKAPDDEEEIAKQVRGPSQGYSGAYRDDLTGQVLNDEMVKAARATELAFFNTKGVWRKVSKLTARAATGRAPISVRWVDVNKGDDLNPNYRSRLAARQLKATDTSGKS